MTHRRDAHTAATALSPTDFEAESVPCLRAKVCIPLHKGTSENLPRLISGGGGALGWSRRPTDVVDVARPHERAARESDMTAAAFSAAHAAGDAAPMDLVPHAKSAGVPEKKSAADSAADAATAARDKSKNDAKHGKKSKTSKADARDDRVDAKDAKDAM